MSWFLELDSRRCQRAETTMKWTLEFPSELANEPPLLENELSYHCALFESLLVALNPLLNFQLVYDTNNCADCGHSLPVLFPESSLIEAS